MLKSTSSTAVYRFHKQPNPQGDDLRMEKNTVIGLTTKTNSDDVMEKEQKKAKILDDVKSGEYFYGFNVAISMVQSYFAGKRFGSLEAFLDYFISWMKDRDQAKETEQILIDEFEEWLEPYWQEFYAPFMQDEVETDVKERISHRGP